MKREDAGDEGSTTNLQSLFKFVHSLLSTLYTRSTSNAASLSPAATASIADLCLRQFLAAGQVADQTGLEEVSYEFYAQAFTVYEESVSDSRAQFQAVCIMANSLYQTRNFGRDNYDTLITKCALHGSRLLKKPDQCRAVSAASHLWWVGEVRGRGEEDTKDVSPLCVSFELYI